MRVRNHLSPESRKKLSSKTEGTGSDTRAHLKPQGAQYVEEHAVHLQKLSDSAPRQGEQHLVTWDAGEGTAQSGRQKDFGTAGANSEQKKAKDVTREVNQGQATAAL